MRILVLSDSHGADHNVIHALMEHKEADAIVFLGDGERDIETARGIIAGKPLICVKGNCDFYSQLPEYALERMGGKLIYATHGYCEQVKYGNTMLIERARRFGADIVLYGHTHTPHVSYEDGLYVFNPGSLKERSYGFVDITSGGIMCSHLSL